MDKRKISRIDISFTDEVKKRIDFQADKRGISTIEFCRCIILDKLIELESFSEIKKQLNIRDI